MSFMQNEQKNKTNRQLKVTVCHIKASAEITSFSQTLSVLYRSQMICIFILLCLHLKMYLSLAWVITVHRHTSVRTVILVHTFTCPILVEFSARPWVEGGGQRNRGSGDSWCIFHQGIVDTAGSLLKKWMEESWTLLCSQVCALIL